jgi:hypothetical protein
MFLFIFFYLIVFSNKVLIGIVSLLMFLCIRTLVASYVNTGGIGGVKALLTKMCIAVSIDLGRGVGLIRGLTIITLNGCNKRNMKKCR